jgi:hypothetical protein
MLSSQKQRASTQSGNKNSKIKTTNTAAIDINNFYYRPGTFTLYADNDTLHGELTITNEEIIFDEE